MVKMLPESMISRQILIISVGRGTEFDSEYFQTCRKIPFVLLTNGGGVTEEKKAAQMSRKLDLDVSKHNSEAT